MYSLQMDAEMGEAASVGNTDTVTDLAPLMHGRDPGGHEWDFMSTACVVANLDLIITCDSVIAHLAGALGKPVWVALPYGSEWRWLRETQQTAWYGSMTLFRQSKYDQPLEQNWGKVFERIRATVEQLPSH
jgi:ADP-heptose:LPS heptosyltransferase